MFVLVSYDITDDKRRNKIAKAMKLFGDRVQYSVFECNLEDAEMAKMQKKLKGLLDVEEDSIRIYRLCAGCVENLEILGLGKVTEDPDLIMI